MLVVEAIEAEGDKVSGHLTGSTPRWPGLLARRLALSLPHDELPAIRVRGGDLAPSKRDSGASTDLKTGARLPASAALGCGCLTSDRCPPSLLDRARAPSA
jgi:hypothetical protein